jgi:hypothetical protein
LTSSIASERHAKARRFSSLLSTYDGSMQSWASQAQKM